MQSIDLGGRNGSSRAITIYHKATHFGRVVFFRGALLTRGPRADSSPRTDPSRPWARILPGEINRGGDPKSLIFNKYDVFHPVPSPPCASSPAPHRRGHFWDFPPTRRPPETPRAKYLYIKEKLCAFQWWKPFTNKAFVS